MSLIYGDDFIGKTTFPENTNYNFNGLFRNCTGLTSAENLILPATTLAIGCYYGMFQGCTSLTTAPALLATILANGCYQTMFHNCTSLTTAPELPATTLTDSCYANMFYNCTSLNYIKCLATYILANNCTINWVANISYSGTFVKHANMGSWRRNQDGIPISWEIEDAIL